MSNNNLSKEDRKSIWSNELVLQLIGEAKRRPCLWKKNDKHFGNRFAKMEAYEEISNIIGVTPEATRSKLRNLRTIFMQVQRRMKMKDGVAPPPKWEYYYALQFMTGEASQSDETDTNSTYFDYVHGDDETTSIKSLPSVLSIASSAPASPLPDSTSPPPAKRKRDCEDTLAPLYKELARTQEQITKYEATHGSNESFGSYVAINLNSMNIPEMVKRTKARIRLIISEAMVECARLELAECEPRMSDC